MPVLLRAVTLLDMLDEDCMVCTSVSLWFSKYNAKKLLEKKDGLLLLRGGFVSLTMR